MKLEGEEKEPPLILFALIRSTTTQEKRRRRRWKPLFFRVKLSAKFNLETFFLTDYATTFSSSKKVIFSVSLPISVVRWFRKEPSWFLLHLAAKNLYR